MCVLLCIYLIICDISSEIKFILSNRYIINTFYINKYLYNYFIINTR